eukprot:PLAT14300.1.p1 GENE.PLAT14300.1~~PLAT14300.1.p1  ORF type:complete len:339 (+),score=172.22 PLAT14300.1:31-1047(+)
MAKRGSGELTPPERVRRSTAWVSSIAEDVFIEEEAMEKTVELLLPKKDESALDGVAWDAMDVHFADDAEEGGPLTAQYVLVLDALNFCFWPEEQLEYDDLAAALKRVLRADSSAFSAASLAVLSVEELQAWLPAELSFPEPEERVRLLHELAAALEARWEGQAANLLAAAGQSAARAVALLAESLPGFQDHTIYRGRQVALFKRAQICVADWWAAYGRRRQPAADGSDAGRLALFTDMHELTMFADYRVPQLLRHWGVLRYSDELAAAVDGKQEIDSGSRWEVEIRAQTVAAVEQLRRKLDAAGWPLFSVELDWLLWQLGEASLGSIGPHHRTRTIFY